MCLFMWHKCILIMWHKDRNHFSHRLTATLQTAQPQTQICPHKPGWLSACIQSLPLPSLHSSLLVSVARSAPNPTAGLMCGGCGCRLRSSARAGWLPGGCRGRQLPGSGRPGHLVGPVLPVPRPRPTCWYSLATLLLHPLHCLC